MVDRDKTGTRGRHRMQSSLEKVVGRSRHGHDEAAFQMEWLQGQSYVLITVKRISVQKTGRGKEMTNRCGRWYLVSAVGS